jgi:ATP-dependent exoDNAse (exonuclease V) beta subunit
MANQQGKLRLELENKHPRDERIEFFEVGHYYTIDGERGGYKSVTTMIHNLFPQFDADAVIDKMMKSKKWPKSKYFGMSKDEIKAAWDKNRDEAATAGTNLHRAIELYYNDAPQEIPEICESKEYKHFEKFLETHGHKKAYRTEWSVFHEELKLAGQIDMCYENEDGTIDIYDWKRSKEIKKFNPYQTGIGVMEVLPDTNFWHYALQLNTYRYILENKYGKKVKDMAIVVFHPNNDSFQKHKIPNLKELMTELFEPENAF